MNDKQLTDDSLVCRRRFLTSAVVGGAAAVWTSDLIARADSLKEREFCGELSAADPLYLYQSLVPQLQISAILGARQEETKVQNDLSNELKKLWTLSDRLKAKLSSQSKAQPAVERVNSLAYIGHTNAQAAKKTMKSRSTEIARAHSKSQEVITGEIVKASMDLSQQGEKTLKAEEWALLKELLGVIDTIKNIYHPAVEQARANYDEQIKNINKRILAIQSALLTASSSVVKGDKAEAVRQIDLALRELARLPSLTSTTVDPQAVARKSDESTEGDEVLTRDTFIAMLEPVKSLINGSQRLPKVSRNGTKDFAVTPAGFVSSYGIALPDPSSVRAIVRQCIVSGGWWQVVGVTAACLPLWSGYARSEQRKSLIHSALTAIPRGRGSKLWEAAYYLNQLTT